MLVAKALTLLMRYFTMTSTVCVSSLLVFYVGTHFTKFGQVVILIGIQISGLGIMVLSVAFAVFVGDGLPN